MINVDVSAKLYLHVQANETLSLSDVRTIKNEVAENIKPS